MKRVVLALIYIFSGIVSLVVLRTQISSPINSHWTNLEYVILARITHFTNIISIVPPIAVFLVTAPTLWIINKAFKLHSNIVASSVLFAILQGTLIVVIFISALSSSAGIPFYFVISLLIPIVLVAFSKRLETEKLNNNYNAFGVTSLILFVLLYTPFHYIFLKSLPHQQQEELASRFFGTNYVQAKSFVRDCKTFTEAYGQITYLGIGTNSASFSSLANDRYKGVGIYTFDYEATLHRGRLQARYRANRPSDENIIYELSNWGQSKPGTITDCD